MQAITTNPLQQTYEKVQALAKKHNVLVRRSGLLDNIHYTVFGEHRTSQDWSVILADLETMETSHV